MHAMGLRKPSIELETGLTTEFFPVTAIANSGEIAGGSMHRNHGGYGSDPIQGVPELLARDRPDLLLDRSCPLDSHTQGREAIGEVAADQARHFGFAGVCVSPTAGCRLPRERLGA